jgi:hypothetical protein
LSLSCALLIAITGHATALIDQLSAMVDRIGRMSSPGHVNDISFEGTQHINIIGLDHALYRLGLRDRRVVRILTAIGMFAIGVWVVRQVILARLPRAAACSLVALFSMIFLYHRSYDAVVLVLPLVYFTGRARTQEGRARWLFAAGAIAVLFVLYLRNDSMRFLTWASFEWRIWGPLVQAIVLPHPTWLILISMVLLVWGESCGRAGERGSEPAQE